MVTEATTSSKFPNGGSLKKLEICFLLKHIFFQGSRYFLRMAIEKRYKISLLTISEGQVSKMQGYAPSGDCFLGCSFDFGPLVLV